MRIAFFVQYSHAAGTYFRWHNMAIALQQEGHTVDVYAGDHNWKKKIRQETLDGVRYFIVPSLHTARVFHNPNDPFTGLRRLFHLPQESYDVYHLFQPFMHAFVPWWYLRKRKKAVFVYDWDDLWTGGFLEKKQYKLRDKYINSYVSTIERMAQQKSNAVTVCSAYLQQLVLSGVPSAIIHNGYWPKDKPGKAEMQQKWKLSPHFHLAYIGKTAGEIDWIIDGLNFLNKDAAEKVKLIICGPPKDFLDRYDIDRNEHIIYLGEVTPGEAAEIAAASNLGLIPLEDSPFNQSRFPIKFFDFLAVGTPVYMSDVGEIGKIASSVGGVYKGPSAKQEWIARLKQVVAQIKEGGESVNVHSIEALFSWQAIGRQLAAYYHELIQSSKK